MSLPRKGNLNALAEGTPATVAPLAAPTLITEYGVFTFEGGLTLRDIAGDRNVEQVQAATGMKVKVASELVRIPVR